MQDAFFVRDGARLIATELTRGPWSNEHQHGGPPAALLTGAMERAEPAAAEFQLARMTVEFLRPVPIAALEVDAQVTRPGQKVQRLEASLRASGTEVARATGVRIRVQELPLAPVAAAPLLPHPDSIAPFRFEFFRHAVGYHLAVDARIARGEWAKGPIDAWMRARVPLVAGEATSAREAVMIVADAESGVCPPVDPFRYSFANPDLTVYFARAPRSDWVGMQIVSTAWPDGIGLAHSELSDLQGSFGRAAQSLFVALR
jgi:acyl-coenzyme A thioesterase PaaI-like protein